mmetsp:Transcript_8925/g.19044  ORF Transcript_8925/g.19044 Transcript_8925/m.19044 type:complete len:536 (+) Transcript_8925:283-1890(+)
MAERRLSFESSASSDAAYGTSPTSPLILEVPAAAYAASKAGTTNVPKAPIATADPHNYLQLSLSTVIGCSEMLGHSLEDRQNISAQQDSILVKALQACTGALLRDESQRHLFTVAPLDVLVTREDGVNRFHIIEINGTGISGLTNMPSDVVQTVLQSIAELPKQLQGVADPVILVASSGQESFPPVSKTLHEKILYIEALRRGFAALGRTCSITNMTRLEACPASIPQHGPLLVLGYMKQFRSHFQVDTVGRLMLLGRQVHAAINDRFVLNTLYQFDHQVDLHQFSGHNTCFSAGADKGVAYQLYNSFFGGVAAGRHDVMAPRIKFSRAHSREELISTVKSWLEVESHPVVIKPQGTGCGHGIEFFFGDEGEREIEDKVDAAIQSVATNYSLSCGGLPFTVCEFLDTASVREPSGAAGRHHHLTGHKFELRIVVYRDGVMLKAFPSISKVARAAFDPFHPDKGALINNITTAAKETCRAGQEFMLPLANLETLELLGISPGELEGLCRACTHFMRHVLDQVQDCPATFGLPPGPK